MVGHGPLFGGDRAPRGSLRGGSGRSARSRAPLRGRSRVRGCRSSAGRFGGPEEAQLLREEQGHARGTLLRWQVAARDRWDRLDRARPGRAAPLLRQRRGRPSIDDGSLRRSRLDGGGPGRRRTLRGSTLPPALLRGCGRGSLLTALRRPTERTTVRGLEGSTSCSGRLDDVDHGRPSLVEGTVWATSRVTTHRTSRECRLRWGEPRRWLRLRPAHTGLRPRVSPSKESSRT